MPNNNDIELTDANLRFNLYKIYKEEFQSAFNLTPPFWNVKNGALWKKLIEEQGYNETNDMFVYVIKNWNYIKKTLNIEGFPVVGVLWSFRYSFIDLMKNEKSNHAIEYNSGDKSKFKKRATEALFFG
jgi:hypothetical protein